MKKFNDLSEEEKRKVGDFSKYNMTDAKIKRHDGISEGRNFIVVFYMSLFSDVKNCAIECRNEYDIDDYKKSALKSMADSFLCEITLFKAKEYIEALVIGTADFSNLNFKVWDVRISVTDGE